MSKRKQSKPPDSVIHDLVSTWTDTTDEKTIRREVDKWTKPRGRKKVVEIFG